RDRRHAAPCRPGRARGRQLRHGQPERLRLLRHSDPAPAYAAGAAWAPQRLWRAVAASVAGHRLPGLPDAVAAGRRGSYACAWLAGQVLATGRRSNQWRARLLYAAGARAGPRRYGDAGVFIRAV